MRYLVAFDLDGTLLPINSSWELVHRLLGTVDAVRKYRRMYERGEISYREWAELDVSTWRGKDFSIVLREIENIDLMDNAKEAISMLKEDGFLVGIISSGLDILAGKVCKELNMDFCYSARLEMNGNEVIGIKEELPPEEKGKILADVAANFGVEIKNVGYVGDGDSDLSVFRMNIGIKIAYRPRSQEIRKLADFVANDLIEAARILVRWKGSR